MFKQFQQVVRTAALCTVALLTACNVGTASFVNTDITGSALEANFRLKDLSGTERTMESYKGCGHVFWLHPLPRCMPNHHAAME